MSVCCVVLPCHCCFPRGVCEHSTRTFLLQVHRKLLEWSQRHKSPVRGLLEAYNTEMTAEQQAEFWQLLMEQVGANTMHQQTMVLLVTCVPVCLCVDAAQSPSSTLEHVLKLALANDRLDSDTCVETVCDVMLHLRGWFGLLGFLSSHFAHHSGWRTVPPTRTWEKSTSSSTLHSTHSLPALVQEPSAGATQCR